MISISDFTKISLPDQTAFPVLQLPESLNQTTESQLWEDYRKISSGSTLLLDFSLLQEIDGTGAGLLILLAGRARQDGVPLIACGVNPQIQPVLRIFGFHQVMAYCHDITSKPPITSDPVWPDDAGPPAQGWAAPNNALQTHDLPTTAIKANLIGRKAVGPLSGFGQLFRKTYRIRMSGSGMNPGQILQIWKDEFPAFWSTGNYFLGQPGGIQSGNMAVLHLSGPGGLNFPGGYPMIATGLRVVHVSDQSFTFITAEGHILCGMITFSVFHDSDDSFAQVQVIGRGSDPIFEAMFGIGLAHSLEDGFWLQTLRNLASRFGLKRNPSMQVEYFDHRLQWRKAGNLLHNSAVRSGIFWVVTPFRRLAGIRP